MRTLYAALACVALLVAQSVAHAAEPAPVLVRETCPLWSESPVAQPKKNLHVSPDGTLNELHADGVYRPVPGAPKQVPRYSSPAAPSCPGGRCLPPGYPSCPNGRCPLPR